MFREWQDPQHGTVTGGMTSKRRAKASANYILQGWSKRRAILSSVAFMSLIKKGTSRPAHYHALWDDNKVTTDQLQTLTNNLCYIYARCAISIVPPAYYAYLAAFRAQFYMEPETSDSGSVASGPAGGGVPAGGPSSGYKLLKNVYKRLINKNESPNGSNKY